MQVFSPPWCNGMCDTVLVHSSPFLKGLCVSWVFSGSSAGPELQFKGLGLSLSSSGSTVLKTACLFGSLCREYENLKEARKISGEMTEKLKKELFSVNNKVKGECELPG